MKVLKTKIDNNEIRNVLDGISSRLDTTGGGGIIALKDRTIGVIQTEAQRKKKPQKNKQSLADEMR